MPLSRRQRTVLERYKQFKDEPPTVWRLISLSVINHAGLIMFCGAAVAIILAIELHSVAWYFTGFAVGIFSRDIGTFRAVVKVWPVLQFVLDWKKIDELLEGHVEVPNAS